ncbi:hypothetical protein BJX99DRAFT_257454 [Aspergillus californicus]
MRWRSSNGMCFTQLRSTERTVLILGQCSRCETLSRECIYDGLDRRKSRHTHVEFKALHNRLAYLEEQVRLLSGGQQTIDTETVTRGPDADSTSVAMSVQPQGDETSFSWDNLDLGDDWILELPPLPWDNDRRLLVRSLFAKKGSELQFDDESGRTAYVGPTSNRHLMTTISSRAQWIASKVPSENISIGMHEVVLLRIFQQKVHSTFPVLCENICAELPQIIQEAVAHPFLYSIVLAAAAFLVDDDALIQWRVSRETLVDLYCDKFTSGVGHELDTCSFQNVKAFLIRAYLDSLRGKLESATIFNSIACAMAKSLGLHVDCTGNEPSSSPPLWNQTERRSIFWATLWLDRRLAILEGRSCQLDHVDVSTSRPLALLRSKDRFLELPLSLELIFACQVEFFWMQDTSLKQLYSFSDDIPKDDAISDSHLRFISWLASLPGPMRDIPKGRTFHPSFLSFHLSFHTGLILLHRRSLNDIGEAAELSNRRCEESASAITGLLKSYQEHFPETLADAMVLHAAFTSALVHLILLLQPDIVTYRSSLNAVRTTKRMLFAFTKISPPAEMILRDLQEFATKYDISPANSPTFWAVPSGQPPDLMLYDRSA